MHLYFAENGPAMHDQIVALHERVYDLEPPPPPKEAIVVINGQKWVIASAYIHECGPFLYAEWAVGSPEAKVRDVHRAAEMVVLAFLATAAARGLRPMANPTSKGIQMLLARNGFRNTGAPCFLHDGAAIQLTSPRVPEGDTPQSLEPPYEKQTPKPKRRRKVGKKAT